MNSDNLIGLSCVKCSKTSTSEGNKLLVCFEKGCPTVIHVECLPSRPYIDDLGYFCCPFCALERFNRVYAQREKNLEASAVKLADWIWMSTKGDDEQGRRVEGGNVEGNVGVSATKDVENVKGGERMEEEEPLVVEPLLTVIVSDTQGTSNGEEGHGKRVAEEESGTRKLPKSFSTSVVPLERRRILWTNEEEEALKEGVKVFWTSERKNIPWEKIRRAYKDRFHSSRIAANLKDKWTRMTNEILLQKR